MTVREPLRGLTWDHPRALRPLAAFEAAGTGPRVSWTHQPLEDFEAHPIADLAEEYDLLVIDHPGLGSAVASEALRPLEDLVAEHTLHEWRADAVARTWESYRLGHRQWAVPIDAATQVAVARTDLTDPVPRQWEDVPGFARTVPTTLCLGGPHALLGLLAMCASASAGTEAPSGAAPGATPGLDGATAPDGALVDVDVATSALAILREVHHLGDRRLAQGNPIAIHDALARRTGPLFCPLAYGYASYARPQPGAGALTWADAPGMGGGRPGSVLGGTGIAVSARRAPDAASVREWLSAFLRPTVQAGLVCEHSGQPASRSAWDSPAADRAWGGYYSRTRRSLEAAHLRPRVSGWIALQDSASAAIRDLITAGGDARAVLTDINHRYRTLRSATRAGTR